MGALLHDTKKRQPFKGNKECCLRSDQILFFGFNALIVSIGNSFDGIFFHIFYFWVSQNQTAIVETNLLSEKRLQSIFLLEHVRYYAYTINGCQNNTFNFDIWKKCICWVFDLKHRLKRSIWDMCERLCMGLLFLALFFMFAYSFSALKGQPCKNKCLDLISSEATNINTFLSPLLSALDFSASKNLNIQNNAIKKR